MPPSNKGKKKILLLGPPCLACSKSSFWFSLFLSLFLCSLAYPRPTHAHTHTHIDKGKLSNGEKEKQEKKAHAGNAEAHGRSSRGPTHVHKDDARKMEEKNIQWLGSNGSYEPVFPEKRRLFMHALR